MNNIIDYPYDGDSLFDDNHNRLKSTISDDISILQDIENNIYNFHTDFSDSSNSYNINGSSFKRTDSMNTLSDITDNLAYEVIKEDIKDYYYYYNLKLEIETAIMNSNIEMLDIIKDIDNYYPIHMAILQNNISILVYLIKERRCDINQIDDTNNQSSLSLAIINKRIIISRILLKYNVDVNIFDNTKRTSVHYCSIYNQLDILKLMICRSKAYSVINNGHSILLIAAYYGNIEIVKFLLSIGYDINTLNVKYNVSALHMCAMSGKVDVCNILLIYSINVNIRDKHGNTALMYAVRYNHIDIVKLLYYRVDNIKITNNLGENIYDIANEIHSEEIVDYFNHQGFYNDINSYVYTMHHKFVIDF